MWKFGHITKMTERWSSDRHSETDRQTDRQRQKKRQMYTGRENQPEADLTYSNRSADTDKFWSRSKTRLTSPTTAYRHGEGLYIQTWPDLLMQRPAAAINYSIHNGVKGAQVIEHLQGSCHCCLILSAEFVRRSKLRSLTIKRSQK